MAKKQAVKNVSTPNKWLFKGIVFLGMLLMTIGIFGAMLVYKSGDESQVLNFVQYFKNIQDIIKDGGASSTSASILETNSYACIGLFFFAILITLLPTLIMLLKRKADINVKKAFAFASVGSLLYLFANTIFWSQHYVLESHGTKIESINTVFGWGSILIIVGFVVGVVGIVLHELFASKSFITLRNIFAKVGLILMFFIGIFSAYGLKVSYGDSSASEVMNYSIFSAVATLTIDGKQTGSGAGSAAIVFSLASMVFFALTFYKFLFNNPNKKGRTIIVFASIFFVTSLISNICIKSFCNAIAEAKGWASGVNVSLGSGAIVEIVLGLGVVIAAILTRVFRKTDKEVA